eukprot:jgi/Tetstr1/447223/TSEL_034660.t1
MDPLKTPEFSSERMQTALGVSAYHADAKRSKDEAEWAECRDWHFRAAGWDPCYNVSVSTDLRVANYGLIAKNEGLYKNRVPEAVDTKSPKTDRVLPENTAMNVYPSAKLSR